MNGDTADRILAQSRNNNDDDGDDESSGNNTPIRSLTEDQMCDLEEYIVIIRGLLKQLTQKVSETSTYMYIYCYYYYHYYYIITTYRHMHKLNHHWMHY